MRLGAAINSLTPEAAQKIVKGLKSAVFKTHITDFLNGGCYMLAKALAIWAGPSSEPVGVWVVDHDYEDAMDHVALRIGEWFFDQNGASTEEVLIKTWLTDMHPEADLVIVDRDGRLFACYSNERHLCAWVGRVTGRDIKLQGYTYPAGKIRELAVFVGEKLGDPAVWGIRRSPTKAMFSERPRPRDWGYEEFERYKRGLAL
jgi:hypothetical protein